MLFLENSSSLAKHRLRRRDFIKLGLMATGASLIPGRIFAAISDSGVPERSLSLYNVNTGESLETIYWYNRKYLPSSLAEINYVFRDHRTGEVKAIDTRLLDLLYVIRNKLETSQPFHILSGYRSPSTNALLRNRNRGVAKNSLHIRGKAADINLPTCKLSSFRRVAMRLRGGGVGYYPKDGFIHLDVGPVRYWRVNPRVR